MSLDSAEDLQPGLGIGPYVIERQIARGGFGTIWQARHEETGHAFALKVLHAELLTSEAIVLRFEQEARAIAMSRHPNVVELYELGKLADGRPYMVMELLSGVNVESYIAAHGAVSPERVLAILEPLGSALTAAHARGVVHRDVKASNVVLSQHQGRERVVLLDFGIAKLLEGNDSLLTGARVTIGSPACISPEQIQGRPVDARTDVYALGVLVFHLLTGGVPFAGSSIESVHQHLTAPRPRPSDRIDVSPAFDDVIVKAMARDPADRFDSVNAFISAFRAAAGGRAATTAAGTSAQASPCIGIYVSVRASSEVLDDADDALLDDMEAAGSQASRFLGERGYLLAYENGTSALFVKPIGEGDIHLRQQALDSACELLAQLEGRRSRDPRVQLSLHLHVASATITGTSVAGGLLLDVATWVQAGTPDAVVASGQMIHGLSVPAGVLLALEHTPLP